jgi:hypothetical protein
MTLTDADVSAFLPRIRSLARRTIAQGCPRTEFSDLVAVGLGALAACANDYDPDAGASFDTYAHTRIRGAMAHWWQHPLWPQAVASRLRDLSLFLCRNQEQLVSGQGCALPARPTPIQVSAMLCARTHGHQAGDPIWFGSIAGR